MNYCKTGERATIKYKFPEKAEMTYTAKSAPVQIIIRPITARNYVFTGYYCEYWIDGCDPTTGRITGSQHYRDAGARFSEGTLLSPNTKIIYPPFEYPITEWLDFTGFGSTGIGESNYCRYQYYRQGIRFSDSTGERKIAYFNFFGDSVRTWRQASNCYAPYMIRDITFRRVDNQEDPLKWEINISSKQGSFTDYGLGMPTYDCLCGDCPQDSFRCGSYHYPGYNCVTCSSLKSEISAMRSMIRRING